MLPGHEVRAGIPQLEAQDASSVRREQPHFAHLGLEPGHRQKAALGVEGVGLAAAPQARGGQRPAELTDRIDAEGQDRDHGPVRSAHRPCDEHRLLAGRRPRRSIQRDVGPQRVAQTLLAGQHTGEVVGFLEQQVRSTDVAVSSARQAEPIGGDQEEAPVQAPSDDRSEEFPQGCLGLGGAQRVAIWRDGEQRHGARDELWIGAPPLDIGDGPLTPAAQAPLGGGQDPRQGVSHIGPAALLDGLQTHEGNDDDDERRKGEADATHSAQGTGGPGVGRRVIASGRTALPATLCLRETRCVFWPARPLQRARDEAQ